MVEYVKPSKDDPSDIMYGCEVITNRMNEDEDFAAWVLETIERRIVDEINDKEIVCPADRIQLLGTLYPFQFYRMFPGVKPKE